MVQGLFLFETTHYVRTNTCIYLGAMVSWRVRRAVFSLPRTKYIIVLSDLERERLEAIIREKKEPEKTVLRAGILLALGAEKNRKKTVLKLAEELGTTHTTIQTVKTAYCLGGLDAAVFRKKRTVTFVNKRINENVIKQILLLAEQIPPNGCKRWSVRLLCRECMDRGIVSHIAPSTMQGILSNAGIDLKSRSDQSE